MKIKSVFLWSMGCRKLTYYQNETPLKVVYKADEQGQKPVQRFIRIDPMAVFTPGISPYTYANDNPVLYIDYYGLGIKDLWNKVKDFTMTKVLGYQKHGSHSAGNVYYTRNKKNNYKPNYASVTPDEPPPPDRPKIDPIDPIGGLVPNDQPSMDVADVPQNDIPPSYKGRPVKEKLTVTEDIPFKKNSDKFYDLDVAEETLKDLVQTLIDFPQLTLYIAGNVGSSYLKITGHSKEALDQSTMLNGKWVPARDLMNARARSVYNYLISKGIDPSRLTPGPGNVYNTGSGKKTSFELRNP